MWTVANVAQDKRPWEENCCLAFSSVMIHQLHVLETCELGFCSDFPVISQLWMCDTIVHTTVVQGRVGVVKNKAWAECLVCMERAQWTVSLGAYRQRAERRIGKLEHIQRGFYPAKNDGNWLERNGRKKSCRVLMINGRFALSVLSPAFGQTQPKVHSPSEPFSFAELIWWAGYLIRPLPRAFSKVSSKKFKLVTGLLSHN
jgi:hypothetical protein